MSLIVPSRRGFIAGIASLIAAPAIVRASSLMPIRGIILPAGGVKGMVLYPDQIDNNFFTLTMTLDEYTHQNIALAFGS